MCGRINAVSGGNVSRDQLGCIVTVQNTTTGKQLSWHIAGLRGAAIRSAADRIDALGPVWKVVSYSSAATVLSDLRQVPLNGDTRHPGRPALPEPMLFSRIGRADLVHPRLCGDVQRNGRRRAQLDGSAHQEENHRP